MTNNSSTPGHDPAGWFVRNRVWLAVSFIVIFVIVLGAILAWNALTKPKTAEGVKVTFEQVLVAPQGIPEGIVVKDGRFRCADNMATIVLKKGGQVKSPKGDTVKAIWSTNAVTVVVTPAEGAKITDAYKAFIFVGEGGTMVASASTPPADATEIRFVANFGKDQPFAPIARATGVSVCVSK